MQQLTIASLQLFGSAFCAYILTGLLDSAGGGNTIEDTVIAVVWVGFTALFFVLFVGLTKRWQERKQS